MAIVGNLEDMSLPTLVQLIMQEGQQKQCIQLERQDAVGRLFLDQGRLRHADLTTESGTQTGELVVYELLSWQDGEFVVEKNITSPMESIEQSWDYLLMEGLRQLDERQSDNDIPEANMSNTLPQLLSNLSESDREIIQSLIAQEEANDMASKSEQLKALTQTIVADSSDINGVAVVDNDGLLLSSQMSGSYDGNRVAAVTAGLIALATRSAQQLGQGTVKQALVQTETGNIIILRAGNRASFVALTQQNANLGMVFMECRDAADAISNLL